MALSGAQRILEDVVRLAAADHFAAWSAAAPACCSSCRPVVKNMLPPAAVRWLQQHDFYRALTAAVAAGLRILQQQLVYNSSDAGHNQTIQLSKVIVPLMNTTCYWIDACRPTEGPTHHAQAPSAGECRQPGFNASWQSLEPDDALHDPECCVCLLATTTGAGSSCASAPTPGVPARLLPSVLVPQTLRQQPRKHAARSPGCCLS